MSIPLEQSVGNVALLIWLGLYVGVLDVVACVNFLLCVCVRIYSGPRSWTFTNVLGLSFYYFNM